MKMFPAVMIVAMFLALPAAMAQYGGQEKGKDAAVKTQETVPPTTSYKCPMHPDVMTDKPGKCPKCGMVMTKSGPTAYYCPRHTHEVSDKPVPCPICKKEMVPTMTPERFQGSNK